MWSIFFKRTWSLTGTLLCQLYVCFSQSSLDVIFAWKPFINITIVRHLTEVGNLWTKTCLEYKILFNSAHPSVLAYFSLITFYFKVKYYLVLYLVAFVTWICTWDKMAWNFTCTLHWQKFASIDIILWLYTSNYWGKLGKGCIGTICTIFQLPINI